MLYQQKPVEAFQLNEESREGISQWINGGVSGGSENRRNLSAWYYPCCDKAELFIETTKGTVVAGDSDWIIQSSLNEFSVMKDSQFKETYSAIR